MNGDNLQVKAEKNVRTSQIEKIESVKNRLNEYRALCEEIENEFERLDRMRMKATSVSGMRISDMPRIQPHEFDRTAEIVARIIDLEKDIEGLVDKKKTEGELIESLIRKLEKPDERAIIRVRYLDHEEWEDVMFVLFGNRSDYNQKYDAYKQTMFRRHRSAIAELAKLC